MTFLFPEGRHLALISVGPRRFHALLPAGTIWVISRAMTEASRQTDENAQVA